MNPSVSAARARLVSLALCVIGAGSIWFNPSEQLRSGTRAISLVVLAGVGALLAGRGALRRVVAVVVLLAGLGLIGGGTAAAMVGGIIAVIGGLIAVFTCKSWPAMGGRYDRPATASGVAPGVTEPAAQPEKTDLWAALDRGEDPTAR